MNNEKLKYIWRNTTAQFITECKKYKKMELKEIKNLLQLYFEGETSLEDERRLEEYFQSGEVADELKEYAEFFGGISELAAVAGENNIEEDVMDFILENEHREKSKYRSDVASSNRNCSIGNNYTGRNFILRTATKTV